MSAASGPVAWIVRLGAAAARVARRVVPDPFVVALLLAAATLVAGIALGQKAPLEVVSSFAFGFLEPPNLAFAFQMVLVLLTGGAIAQAPMVDRALRRLADWPTTSAGAAAMVAAVAMGCSLLNWGFGLVAGALLAREVGRSFARRALPLPYGVVGAAAYVGMAVWHGGLSGSAPLKVAVDGAFGPAIPVSATLLSPLNLATTSAVFIAFVALFFVFGRSPPTPGQAAPPELHPPERDDASGIGAERLERAPWVLLLLVLPIAVALGLAVIRKGVAGVNLDVVILLFLSTGMLLHRSPRAYARAFAEGAREASGIALQFPIYFGVIAAARDAGLVQAVADAFSALALALDGLLAREANASVITYLSACAINMLVPSGGGQWAVQSPIILEMSKTLGVERAPLVMAFAYGDQTTNLLQPFWALPLLSLSGLKARDIMGYTMVALVVEMAIVVPCLLIFSG